MTDEIVADAVKAAGAGGSLLAGVATGFSSYLLMGMGAALAGLSGTIAFYHYVTVPRAEAKAAAAIAAEQVAQTQAQVCLGDKADLQRSVDEQNARIEGLQAQAAAGAAASGAKAAAVLKKSAPLPGHGAAEVNAFVTGVLP